MSGLRDQIPPSIENLRTLAGKIEHRQQRLSVVAAVAGAKLAALQNEISVRSRDGLDAAIALIATDHGADAMDQLRGTLVGMRAEEEATRDPLRTGLHAAITRTTFAFGFASFLALALLFGVHHLGKRNNERLRRDAASLSSTLRTIADADKRKDEFLAMLAHELRNPIAAIGNAVSLATYSRLPEHIDWTMEVIDRQSKHLARMIDDLLDVSRINRGKIELRRRVVDATAVVNSAVESARPLVDERGHRLHLSIERGNLWLNCDPTRLEQVVTNLLNNAAKYTDDRGQIWLSACREDGEIVITIKDTGAGIPPDRLPEMFELFAQGDRTLARSEGGLGIGLTVVKRLVEAHGGKVTANSEGIGKGTEFSVRLPEAKRPATDGSREPATAEARKSSGAFSSSTTTSTWSTAWPRSSRSWATTCRSPTAGRRRSKRRRASGPRSSCSTSGCRAWTVTLWRIS